MPLNIVSNQAASIANRALTQADREMTTSLRKLSSGLRVESARDDAASMAIGSRLKAELSALKTVSTNAQQGIAVFQIAEGGYARIYDILVRLKALASQAGSSQLSATERGMLDTEYQAMVDEIDRLAANTTFNGNQIINASVNRTLGNYLAGTSVIDFGHGGMEGANMTFGQQSDANSNMVFSINNGTKTLTGSLASNLLTSTGTLVSGTAVRLYSATSGDNAYAIISLAATTNMVAASQSGTVGVQSSTLSYSTFAFKVGTSGISANDEISLGVRGMNSRSLGINLSNITTVARSDSASAAVTEAINVLLNARSEVGAVQNRLETAQSNIATILENIEAARSAQLDLDIAAEMSYFTSKQILVQAGVSMLAQANQAPQNLLRLFQN